MKFSTVTLSVLLVAAVAYAAFLQTEVSRLKSSRPVGVAMESGVEIPTSETTAEMGAGMKSGTEVDVEVAASQPASVSEGGNRESRRRERIQSMAAAFDDPQMRVDMIERQMERVDSRYANFFRTLNLSAEELDTLRTLMAEQGVVGWEMRMKRFGAETDEERDRLDGEARFQRDVLADEIEELLGEDNAVAMKDYTDSLPYRGEVESLMSSLSFTDTPLSDSQSEKLVSTIQNVSEGFKYTKDLSAMRGPQMGSLTSSNIDTYFREREERDAAIVAAASKTLSEEQLAAYAERQLAERERDRRQMEFMQKNPPPAGGPGGRGGFGGGDRGPRP